MFWIAASLSLNIMLHGYKLPWWHNQPPAKLKHQYHEVWLNYWCSADACWKCVFFFFYPPLNLNSTHFMCWMKWRDGGWCTFWLSLQLQRETLLSSPSVGQRFWVSSRRGTGFSSSTMENIFRITIPRTAETKQRERDQRKGTWKEKSKRGFPANEHL